MAHLSTAQLQALKAAIEADPILAAQPNSADGNDFIAKELNKAASPTYWCLKTSVTQMDLQSRASVDGTTFDWANAGGFIARSQGERDAYRTMFAAGSINPSFGSARTGLDDIFSGTGVGAVANRTHWRAVARRPMTRFEKVFAVATSPAVGVAQPPGSGAGARGETTHPDTCGLDLSGAFIQGHVDLQHIQDARNS